MHIAAVVLSVLLAVELAFTAIIKIAGTGTARTNAAHLGISLRLSRFIGIAELAAVVGLLAGIAVKPLAIVTAAAVVLLMAGAVGYHLKARDYGVALLPAAITGLAAVALVVLTIAA
ncbi:DoxX family protein [Mycobacterium sp.]|uniref:DoxX family protein n=1 Tax=Mycobacterium sp. TaxID=1785 RepID=UPI003F9D3B7C